MHRALILSGIFLAGSGVAVANMPTPIKPIDNPGHSYSWTTQYDQNAALTNRIAPPAGFTRTKCVNGSFCEWLRFVPLKPEGSPVRYHYGGEKVGASNYAVLDLDTGEKDLQQCADAVMRLKAEYHYSRREFSPIAFNFTSGHKVAFNDWRRGSKPIVRGNKVRFTPRKETTDNSYRNFKKYMTIIFSYAGTLSLAKEMKPVSVEQIRPGDVFIRGGSPGHAMMVMDVAENAQGEKVFMLAQSYMPAQDMHIVTNFERPEMGPWYSTEFAETLFTPEWSFKRDELKRFRS